jgi:ubiquinone/menaquinone biosynthesis C-methylase UbiE
MKNTDKYNSSAIDYYNSISNKYDDLLNTNPLHKIVRDEVKQYFLENVPGKIALDFGGGTGGDLPWLLEAGFKVIFCEPAERMKQIAVGSVKKMNSSEKVNFLSHQSSDYQYWSKDNLPFEEKADAVLSNFAVLNSIKDLHALSEKLALVTNEDSHLIVVVLNVKAKYLIRSGRKILKSLFKGNGLAVRIKYGEAYLTTYLHRKKKIIKSMSNYFEVIRRFPLSDDSFLLIHFIRNNRNV